MLPEAAEAHLPLRSDIEKEKEDNKAKDTENHNYTQQPPQIGFLPLSHLNGSVKLTVSETVDAEQNANKTEQQPPHTTLAATEEEEPHSLWKFPRDSGKFTQVSNKSHPSL